MEDELLIISSQKIDNIKIDDELSDILFYIYNENRNNSLVSFKKLMMKFKIVYSTVANKIKMLEEDELIYTKRFGKLRTVHITEKGKTLIYKKQTI